MEGYEAEILSGSPLDRLDAVVQGSEVEADDILPNPPNGMLLRDQVVERRGAEDDLIAHGHPEPRHPGQRRAVADRLRGRFGRHLEERGWMGYGLPGARWGVHGKTIAKISCYVNAF